MKPDFFTIRNQSGVDYDILLNALQHIPEPKTKSKQPNSKEK
jgi:hypothetical protein